MTWAGRSPKPLKVQEEIGTFLLSKLDKSPDDAKAANVRQEVLLEFENSERASAQELLAIDGAATAESIERAYEAQRSAWTEKQKVCDTWMTPDERRSRTRDGPASARGRVANSNRPRQGCVHALKVAHARRPVKAPGHQGSGIVKIPGSRRP